MPQADIKLLELMAKRNIRQAKEMAEKAELSDRIILDILNGKKKGLRLDTIVKLCKALECRVDELIVLPEE